MGKNERHFDQHPKENKMEDLRAIRWRCGRPEAGRTRRRVLVPVLGGEDMRRGLVPALGRGGEETRVCARPRAGGRGDEGVCRS